MDHKSGNASKWIVGYVAVSAVSKYTNNTVGRVDVIDINGDTARFIASLGPSASNADAVCKALIATFPHGQYVAVTNLTAPVMDRTPATTLFEQPIYDTKAIPKTLTLPSADIALGTLPMDAYTFKPLIRPSYAIGPASAVSPADPNGKCQTFHDNV
jgi:hypothetical protein